MNEKIKKVKLNYELKILYLIKIIVLICFGYFTYQYVISENYIILRICAFIVICLVFIIIMMILSTIEGKVYVKLLFDVDTNNISVYSNTVAFTPFKNKVITTFFINDDFDEIDFSSDLHTGTFIYNRWYNLGQVIIKNDVRL